MVRIYEDAKDLHVANVLVYANESKALFYDEAFTQEVSASDGVELFLKGVVCLYDGAYYAAVSVSTAGVLDFGL